MALRFAEEGGIAVRVGRAAGPLLSGMVGRPEAAAATRGPDAERGAGGPTPEAERAGWRAAPRRQERADGRGGGAAHAHYRRRPDVFAACARALARQAPHGPALRSGVGPRDAHSRRKNVC